MSYATWRGMDIGDMVVSTQGTRGLVVRIHDTAKALVGILSDGEIKYVHYKHLEVVSRCYEAQNGNT